MHNEHITPTHYYIKHHINTFSTASAYLQPKKQQKHKKHKRSKKTGVNEVNIPKDIHFSMNFNSNLTGEKNLKSTCQHYTILRGMH